MGQHSDRGSILFDQGRYDLAEAEFRLEIAEDPDDDTAYTAAALCCINQLKIGTETLALINSALALNAENDWNHYTLAFYWYVNSNLDLSIKSIKIAIELDPYSDQYFFIFAQILFDRGQNKFTAQKRIILVVLFFTTRGILCVLGLAILPFCQSYLIRSYLKPVFDPLEKSLAINPEHLPTLNLLTELLITTARPKRAFEISQTALQVDPNHAISHKFHGQLLTIFGRYSAAVDHFKSSLSIDPSSSEAKVGLLESMRSQYWIYPWISITNWRGKSNLLSAFITLGLLIVIATFIDVSDRSVRFIWVVFLTVICLSFTAKPIFNLLLQLNPNHKLLIANIITTNKKILGNYIAVLSIACLSSFYLILAVGLLPINKSVQTGMIASLSIIAGILVSIVTFLPLKNTKNLSFPPFIYQSIVIGLGLINIIAYLSFNRWRDPETIFVLLVLFSPFFAIRSLKAP